MSHGQSKSRVPLVWKLLIAAVVIVVLSGAGYVVYADNFKITCSDQAIPKTTDTQWDYSLDSGQVYTVDGHDGVASVCTKHGGRTVSKTTKVEMVASKLMKGGRMPTPAPAPTYVSRPVYTAPAPAPIPYIPPVTIPKTTHCNPNYLGGVDCSTY